jgi:uncharacterized protein
MLEFSNPIQIDELKSVGDDWEVSGYPAWFNNVDEGKDIIRPGAFVETLKSGPKVKFFHSHDPRLVLGVPKVVKEDKKGLFTTLKISKTKLGEDVRELVQDGALDSFSIGYRADEWKMTEDDVRELLKITLYEVSLVALPMNPKAVVTGFKDYMTLADRTSFIGEEIEQLISDLRVLIDGVDRPLSKTKRQELTELLESCSGLDAVRSDLQSVLASAHIGKVASKRLTYEVALRKARMAHILAGEPAKE